MGFDIPDRPPKCAASGVAVIGVTDFMLVVDQTKVSIRQFHIVDIPDMPRIVANQGHIIGIRHNHREILPINRL